MLLWNTKHFKMYRPCLFAILSAMSRNCLSSLEHHDEDRKSMVEDSDNYG